MMCHVCLDRPVTDRTNQLPANCCDACLAAIGDIRVWLRESGRPDSIERATEIRKNDLRTKR